MKQLQKRTSAWRTVIGLIAALVVPSSAIAVPAVYTDSASWMAAITAINAPAVFGLEDFNGQALTAGDGLGAGPHVYGGGEFSFTLNGIGNFGSVTGVINPGEFNGSNTFEIFLSHDTSNFACCGGFIILGAVSHRSTAYSPRRCWASERTSTARRPTTESRSS